jgi:peptidoglycan/LPS O-acetylase OafA/YrhL
VHASTVLAQAAHLTNYYIIRRGWWEGIAPGTWVYWSLAIEEHFYLFFPLLYIGLTRYLPSRSRQAQVLLVICALVLAWRCVLVFVFHVWKDRVYLATDTRVDAILAGCVLAIWRNPVLEPEAFDDAVVARWWVPLGLLAIAISIGVRAPEFEQTLRYTLQSFGLLPIFVACIRWHDRGICRLLNLQPVRYLGALSYSLYLMHTSLLWVLEERTTLAPLPRGILALGVLIILGALMQRYVEQPLGRLRRHLTRLAAKQAAAPKRVAAA